MPESSEDELSEICRCGHERARHIGGYGSCCQWVSTYGQCACNRFTNGVQISESEPEKVERGNLFSGRAPMDRITGRVLWTLIEAYASAQCQGDRNYDRGEVQDVQQWEETAEQLAHTIKRHLGIEET